MKIAPLLILTAVSFAAGALLARWGEENALSSALRSDRRPSTSYRKTAKPAADAETRTDEERFGQVLSALQERGLLKRRHALSEAIGDLSAADIASMIERASRMPSNRNYEVMNALLEHWFELDAERAKDWVRARPRDVYYWRIWATKAPESVIVALQQMRNPLYYSAAGTLETAIATLAGPEKQAQAARLAALPADSTRDQVLKKTMAAWAITDAAAAFAFARGLPSGTLRQNISETTLRQWAKTDPRSAAQEVMAMLPELTPGLTGNGTIAAVAAALSKDDPQAALRWLSQLPEEHRNSGAYVSAASAWAKTEPLAALAWCRENGVDPAGRWDGVIGAAMGSDPLATVRWVQTLPPGEERNRLLEQAISCGGKLTFPPITDANAKVVMELLPQLPPDAQERVAYQLGWASGHRGKLEHVRAWIERLTDEALRAAAVEAAVQYRFGANPFSREELLEQFPDGSERDGALAGIASREWERAPARAVQTALEIADPTRRHDLLDGIISDWIERSPAEARTWIRDAGNLPPEWRNAWLAESNSPD